MDDLKGRFMAALAKPRAGSIDAMASAEPIGRELGLDARETAELVTQLADDGLLYVNLAPITVKPTERGAAWTALKARRRPLGRAS